MVLSLGAWPGAAARRNAGGAGDLHPMARSESSPRAGVLSAIPVAVVHAACSGVHGTATLALRANPFRAGQWIAMRGIPPAAPVVVTGEKVATGDGSRTTFTFRTASYPIRRGTVTILVNGQAEGIDNPAGLLYEVGLITGPGIGTFQGTVTISGGSLVTLTSTPAVFDPRWIAYMPTIGGVRGKYIIGNGIDASHLKLMAPGADATGQSFTLSSQISYVSGLIEVTFKSPPAGGAPVTINYTAEPSQWNGEHRVLSATAKMVSYIEPGCTSARAVTSSGDVYAIPVMYVAPASHSRCAYDGDGGQACSPSDANPGTTKSRPKTSLYGVASALNQHVLTVPYMVQLADANGSGLGGSKPAKDCYQPDAVTFSDLSMGGSPADQNERLRVEHYPASYLWIHGNSRDPGRVLINGSGNCAPTSRTIGDEEALRFDHTVARVDGFSIQGYGNLVGESLGPTAITFVNFATGFVEDIVCTGDQDRHPRSVMICFGAWDHSTLKTGGNHIVNNADWVLGTNLSNVFTADPADSPRQNTNLSYSSAGNGIVIGCHIVSNCQVDRLTASFTGSGKYTIQAATEKSSLYYAERYFGAQCPHAACMDLTINAPNATWESSQLGGHIDGDCVNSQEGVCTVISGPAVRAFAQEDSFVKEYGQSVVQGAQIEAAGGCIEIWNAGWNKSPGSQPPVCTSRVLKSESNRFVPLTLENAGGSSKDILDLKNGAGALAAAFNSSGQLSKIGGVRTAGNGVGSEVYYETSAGVDSSLPSTRMLVPQRDGTFTARFYIVQTSVGSGCTTPARVVVNLVYTDPSSAGAEPFTFAVPLQTSGAATTRALTLGASGAVTNAAAGSMMFRAKGATPISYSTAYTAGACATQPQYRLTSVLEWY